MLDIYAIFDIIKLMIRKMIHLTEEQQVDIKLRAMREDRPEAVVIRDLISAGQKALPSQGQESTGDSLLRLANIRGKGPADLSTRTDDYLYGEDR
jgi:hypothetical protein